MPYGNLNVDTVTTSTTGGVLGAGNASIMKNRCINGDMRIDQRNAGASVSTTDTTQNIYTLDRWYYRNLVASKYTIQQNAGSVTPPVGFTNYLGCTSTSAYTVGAADFFSVSQNIEGFNFADLQWGTANAKTITLSAWVYSSLTGTFGGALLNSAGNRSYPFTYSIPVANTWTQISITIAGDTTGTWVGATNGIGVIVRFSLGSGSTYSGTAGSWAGTAYTSATGATSVVGTNGATFYITGIQLEVGSSATGFEYRQYQQELALCQRYLPAFSGSGQTGNGGNAISSSQSYVTIQFPVTTRVSPTGITVNTIGYYTTGCAGITGDVVLSSLSFNQASTSTALLLAQQGAGANLTSGQLVTLRANNSAAVFYFTGCEL